MKVTLGTKTILLGLVFLLVSYFLWWAKGLLLILILSYSIAAALRTIGLNLSEKLHLDKKLSFVGVYSGGFLILSWIIWILTPLIGQEIKLFALQFPNQFLSFFFSISHYQPELVNYSIGSVAFHLSLWLAANLADITFSTLSIFFNLFLILLFTFYFLVDYDHIVQSPLLLKVPKGKLVKTLEGRLQTRLGKWVIVQTCLAVLTGGVLGVGLYFIGVDYFLTLTVVTILLNLIPIIGGFLALLVVLVIATVQNPLLGLWVFLVFNLVGLVKDNFLTPKLIRLFGFTPLTVLLFFIIGTTLFGFLGAIVSVPLLVGVSVLVEEIEKENRRSVETN